MFQPENSDGFKGGKQINVGGLVFLYSGSRHPFPVSSDLGTLNGPGHVFTGLTMDNTDVDAGTIKVVGKGNEERIVTMGAATKKALLRYMVTWRPEPMFDDIDQVILSTDDTPLTTAPSGT